jgi:transcriptional antiterminator Rof (Rho-off)
MSDYQSISCEAHSIYELVIMRGQSIQVSIDGNIQTTQPKDIFTKSSVEYLTFIDENCVLQELRIDCVIIDKSDY